MKKLLVPFTMALLVIASCNNKKNSSENSQDTTLESSATAGSSSETWVVDPKASSLVWKGTKPTGFHEGTILIKEGSISTEDKKITAGKFLIDMTTIVETTSSDKPKAQEKLVSHLKSDDFFNVDSFPVSTFAVTKVEGNTVFGNLTIKNQTHEISFPSDIKIDGAILKATANFDIDRTEWGINFNSLKKLKDKLADNFIGDKITYKVDLVAYKE